jgi:hypothetical protein
MRISWINRWACLTLAATCVALQGAHVVSAQNTRYGNQDQLRALPPAPRYASLPQRPTAQVGAVQQPTGSRYTPTSYMQAAPDVVEPVAPTPDPPIAPGTGGAIVEAPAAAYQGGYYASSYNSFDCGGGYANGPCGETCRGKGSMQGCGAGGHRWFGGIYGLMMERDDSSSVPLAFVTANGVGSYPTDAEIAMTADDSDVGFQGGLELRFGAYFGGPSGCQSSGCGPSRAWEFVYWGLFEDSSTVVINDTTGDATRTHGMINFDGLQFDAGGGARGVNEFFDTGLPITDNTAPVDIEVRSLSARSTFQMHNLEANLLRLPVLNGGGGSRYELATFIGSRFMRIDDDFWFRSDFEIDPGGAGTLGSLTYDSETDNTLYGVQIGGNSSYRCGSSGRFSLICNTVVGLYGNHMEVTHRLSGATFITGGGPAVVQTEEDDISVVGEMRLGAAYQPHDNWRVYAGWRVVGMTGIARAVDQIPSQFLTPGQVGVINSDGSMLVHGLQTGMEFSY